MTSIQPYDPTPGQLITTELHKAHFDINWVAPRVYMGAFPAPWSGGSLVDLPRPGKPVRLRPFGFDAVAFCAYEMQPDALAYPDVQVLRVLLDDIPAIPSPEVRRELAAVVRELHSLWNDGKRVLITCAMGKNRSGLVTGLLLRSLGFDAEQAIHDIRAARRHVGALTNTKFEQLIRDVEFKP